MTAPRPALATAPASPSARSAGLLTLVATLALVTLELVRSSGPLLDMAFSQGVVAAAATALATYAVPGAIAVVLVAAAGRRRVRQGTRNGPDVAATGPEVSRVVSAAALGALVLAAVRAALPLLTAGVRFGVGLAAVALAVAALTLATAAAARRHGGAATSRAIALGLAAQVGLQLALGTWDAVWRTDVAGWAVTLLLVAALVATALGARRADGVAVTSPDGVAVGPAGDLPARPSDRLAQVVLPRVWALGPFLALAVMVTANPAFAASQTGTPVTLAGLVVGVGLLAGAWATRLLQRPVAPPAVAGGGGSSRTARVAIGTVVVVVLAGATAGTLLVAGPFTLVPLLGLAVGTPVALALALTGRRDGPGRPWRTAAAATLVGLGTILPLLVYQLDYDVPLGFPNALVVVAAAAALGLAGAGAHLGVTAPQAPPGTAPQASPGTAPQASPGTAPQASGPARPQRSWSLAQGQAVLAGLAAGLVVVGVVVSALTSVTAHRASTEGADRPEAAGDVTVVVWNLHYGVTPAGHVRLEDVASAIEGTGACVVLLQEVSRGWVMGGGADMGTWLANRLDMRLSFAPAADHQFGNAILSCVPHHDVVVHDLPYGDGPQQRSAISATVALPEPQRYTSVHLQHRERNTPTRLAQLETLLGAGDLGVLGGDFNSEPGWAEIDLVLGSGFTSAQDEVGDPDLLTSPTTDLRHRIDWVFVPDDVEAATLEHLTEALWSDHVGLVLTHRG